MNFIYIPYGSYNFRYTVIDGVDMYLVSDVLDQYNEHQGREYTFEEYLEDKDTRELLIEKFHLPYNYNPRRWNIKKVIKYITYTRVDGTKGQDYVVNQEWLINCLTWVDPMFTIDVCKFFMSSNEEEADSNRDWSLRLCREVRKFQKMLKDLRDKYAPDVDLDLSTDTLVL